MLQAGTSFSAASRALSRCCTSIICNTLRPTGSYRSIITCCRFSTGVSNQHTSVIIPAHSSGAELRDRCTPGMMAARAMGSGAGEAPQVGVIDVAAVQQLLRAGENADVQLVDVREEDEHQIASLPGFQLLPLSRFQEWAPLVGDMLDPEKETLVLCHHGMRSMRAALFLASQGFQNVKNIEGGIDAYSRQADSSIPLY